MRTFPSANIKQFQYLRTVQHLVTQLSVDLKVEKHERIKLHATIRLLEDELAQLRRKVNEFSSPSLPVPCTIDPWSSTVLQGKRALERAPNPKPMPTITIMRASSTLEPRVKHLEEEITKERDCREAVMATFLSQFTFHYNKFQALEPGSADII